MEKVKHLVPSWVSFIPLFKGIPINSIIHNWKEVVFSHPIQSRALPRWCPLPPGALKLNFDGSACGNPSPAGLGGFIRDTERTILLSYSGPAGFDFSKAELLALRTGIHEGSKLNPQQLLIEEDSYCVIQWVNQSSNPPWNHVDIIEEVVQMSWELNVSFHHIKGLANQEAYKLAKEGVLKTALNVSM